MDVLEVLPGVRLVDLNFNRQSATVAAFLLTAPTGEAALIETGPTSTLPALLGAVRTAGVDPAALTDILVTHIHLDHSGAAGVVLRDYAPNARVLAHPAGLPHLVEPDRLVRSATRLYGERMDALWGEVAPVPESQVAALDDGARLLLAGHEIEVIYTPGHASHHLAVRHRSSGAIFAGDVAGVRVPGAHVVNPPTVPPEFDPVAWEHSIDRLLALDPTLLLLGHFGPISEPRAHLESLRGRLRECIAFVQEGLSAGHSAVEMGAELRARDAANPDTSSESALKLELVAGYAMSVGGIMRYLTKQASPRGQAHTSTAG